MVATTPPPQAAKAAKGAPPDRRLKRIDTTATDLARHGPGIYAFVWNEVSMTRRLILNPATRHNPATFHRCFT